MAVSIYQFAAFGAEQNARPARRSIPGYDKGLCEGQLFDFSKNFMPESLSLVGQLSFLTTRQRLMLNQIQDRSYINVLGMMAKIINAGAWSWTDYRAWRSSDTALRSVSSAGQSHVRLFSRMERSFIHQMPTGYLSAASTRQLVRIAINRSSWSILALATYFGHLTRIHFQRFIEPDLSISMTFKKVLQHHIGEHEPHVVLDELEWRNEDRRLTAAQRDMAVDDLIRIGGLMDQFLQLQARSDGNYFLKLFPRMLSAAEQRQVYAVLLRAYRWQHIFCGTGERSFTDILHSLTNSIQRKRITKALALLTTGSC